MATTTNMTLVLPTVSATLGPLWASELNAALTLVDSHDHSTGKGVKVTPSGLNINDDLPLNSNDLTTVRTVALDSQSATLSASDIRAVYSVLGDLYWNNGSGTAVQITSGASVQSSASTIARAFERLSVNANKTILAADTYSYLDTDTGSSVTYTLPAANAVAAGRFYEFKDSTGQAATNNITINRAGADTIDGATSFVINANYGSVRLVSDGNSKWMLNPSVTQSKITTFTSNGTWTKSTLNPKFIKVTVIGGGGGGGGTAATGVGESACAGSGGGGGTSIKMILASALGATETVTVGAAGTAGSAGNNAGGTGGTSSFGSHASATGGTGGSGSATFSGTVSRAGGAGGTGSSGTINIDGGAGSNGAQVSGLMVPIGLSGGTSLTNGIGVPRDGVGTSPSANAYGVGGTGANSYASTAARAGGAGAAGIVIVEEFY